MTLRGSDDMGVKQEFLFGGCIACAKYFIIWSVLDVLEGVLHPNFDPYIMKVHLMMNWL